jgi:lipopolysaccharide transport system ATP-binding protein
MAGLGREGHIIIFVSHSMPQVLRLCNRGIWLDHGKIVMDGPVTDVAVAYGANQLDMTREIYNDYRPVDAQDPVVLTCLRAYRADGQPSTQFDVREPVTIEVRYDVKASDLRVAPEIVILDSNHTEILVAGARSSSLLAAASAPGPYVGRVTIPGDLLNEGVHNITVRGLAFDRHELLAESREALTLFISDRSEGDSSRGDYLGPIGGAVRPKLDWTIVPATD